MATTKPQKPLTSVKPVTSNEKRVADPQSTFNRRLLEASTNLKIAEDLLCRDWTIEDNIKHYSIPRNVLVLRMKTLAYQSIRIAKIPFDKTNESHIILNDLFKHDNISETMKKYGATRNDLILNFAKMAYRAIDKAYEAGFTNDTVFRIMAYNDALRGLPIPEAMAKVDGEAKV